MAQSYLRTLYRRIFGKPLEIRLVEACSAVKGLRKNGTNEDLGFDYLRIVDLANELREQLQARDIALVPNDIECLMDDLPDGSVEARVKTEFTITDGDRTLVIHSYGSAIDDNGYAVAIAQTAALKAFLKRVSMIYGDEDDAELPAWVRHEGKLGKKAAQYQARALDAAIRTSGRTRAQIETMISEGIGEKLTVADIASFPKDTFEIAMKIITKNSDLSEVLTESVRQAKGPQPVVSSIEDSRRDEMTGD